MADNGAAELQARLQRVVEGHYRVERLLGEGGMALVYLAEDLKHRRQVAVKLLKPDLAASIGEERFLREIELAARLQHPHIVPVYDSGAGDGLLYYVMPFIEGESLRDRMAREGGLPLAASARIVSEVASALAYAHEHGIVHRDVKPENVLLSGGHAVVADFGIARAAEAKGSHLTGVGVAIGTPAYMSPEQATASDVDARTDQYSLASVFFEMVAGKPAFTGKTPQAILTANITGERPSIESAVPGLPGGLDEVTARGMARDPEDRFPSITEFAVAVEALAASGGRRRRIPLVAVVLGAIALVAAGAFLGLQSGNAGPVMTEAQEIAILPFSVTGTGVELMGEGMVDLLAANLGTIPGVRIVDPRRVMKAMERETGDLEVARALGAGSVLRGSVVGAGDRVRLNAELLSASGESLARTQVEGASEGLLALVDSLSLTLMKEIWRSSEPFPTLRVAGIMTPSVEAMQAYLQGEALYRRGRWDSAGAAYRRAIEGDSTFALAHHRLALTLGWTSEGGASREATRAAIRFADRLPTREAFLMRAYGLYAEGSVAAIDSMQAYTRRFPDDPDGWYYLGEAKFHLRDVRPAAPADLLASFDRVLALDSTLTAAMIHPVELSLLTRDRERPQRYLRLLQAAGSEELGPARVAERIVFDGGAPDSALSRLLARRQGIAGAVLVAVTRGPTVTGDSLVRYARGAMAGYPGQSSRDSSQLRLQGLGFLGMASSALGRLETSRQLADSVGGAIPEFGTLIHLAPVALGIAPPGWADEAMRAFQERSDNRVNRHFFAASVALSERRPDDAAREIAAVRSRPGDLPPVVLAAFDALDGWLMLVRGDTVGGIPALKGAVERAGHGLGQGGTVLRWQLALAMAARPEFRQEGILRLQHGFDGVLGISDFGVFPFSFLPLAKAQEAAGDRTAAAASYGQFIRLWDRPDPRVAHLVQEARDGLARVTGETGS